MYEVYQKNHDQYGNVIEIVREELAKYETPFMALNAAMAMSRLLGKLKTRFLIDGQIMTLKQADNWSNEEYKSLPKCKSCAQILYGDIYTHNLIDTNIFCSQNC